MSRICCAPLTHTRRHFVPNSHFYWVLSSVRHWQISQSIQTTQKQSNTTFNLWTCCSVLHWYRSQSASPTVHKGICYFVFPSFTYLTAAVLSYIVFPFPLLIISFDPSRTVDHHDSRPQWPSDQHASVDFDQSDCDEAVSVVPGGILLDRDKQITPHFTESNPFQWT